MQRKDWTLLLLAAAEGQPLTPVQLQKTAFLLGKQYDKIVGKTYYKFIAYDYGPFNQDVYRDAEVLAADGLAAVEWSLNGRWREYRATPQGLVAATTLQGKLDQNLTNWIVRLVQWARGLTFQQLVRAIYNEYPEYRENSVFKD